MRIQRNYRHHLLVVSSRAVEAVLKRREEEEAALRQRSVYKIQLAWWVTKQAYDFTCTSFGTHFLTTDIIIRDAQCHHRILLSNHVP